MAGRVLTAMGAARRMLRCASGDQAGMPDLVAGLALVPAIVVGLILFRQAALEMLAAALALALAGYLAARLARLPVAGSLVPAALVGVALVGPGAPLAWAALAAALAVAGDLARARFAPGARLQVGLLAYALVLLVSWGGAAAYVAPVGTGQGSDPVRLYVGNVPGPVFATSLLAVGLGAAWLWYARRLSLLVVFTFLAGALVAIGTSGWSTAGMLMSGPLWFAVALVLADRKTLPTSLVGRPLLGLAAGGLVLTVRGRGAPAEAAALTVAALQLLAAGGRAASWLLAGRRRVRVRLPGLRPALPPAASGASAASCAAHDDSLTGTDG